MDIALKDLRWQPPDDLRQKFQSLFWWILLWKLGVFNLFDLRITRVSILILMDIALKDFLHLPEWAKSLMFQSLFWWILLWKVRHNLLPQPRRQVSILILMDIALKVNSRTYPCINCHMFQSLFWWILLWKITGYKALAIEGTCFNPYSDGYCSESFEHRPDDGAKRQFQSLFWWILLWKLLPCAYWPPR